MVAMPHRPAIPPAQQLLLFDDAGSAHSPAAPANTVPAVADIGHLPPKTEANAVSAAAPASAASAAPQEFRHPRSQCELLLAGHRVAYELRRSRRSSIGFVVASEGLSVSAPRWVGVGEIELALREKAAWILRKLQEQRERASRLAAAQIVWRDGASIPFLGRNVTLVLDPHTTGAVLHEAVETQPYFALHLGLSRAAAPEQIRDAVHGWLQRQARRIFDERCGYFAARLGVRMKRLSLSSAATRWGSASTDGSIRLNWRLVHFSLPVIDYVVTHELAHLREMNHSAAFWDVVRSVIPDFEKARGTLRKEILPALD